MDCSLNFIPKMNYETLINGYKSILNTIYSPKEYYERVKVFLKEYKPTPLKRPARLQFFHIRALFNSVWFLGIREKGRRYYWKLFLSTLLKRPRSLPMSITLALYGFHFRKVVEKYLGSPVAQGKQNI